MNLNLSAKDRSIIGAICQYPNLDFLEKKEMIRELEDQSLEKVVSALAGFISLNELSNSERKQLIEIETWRNFRQNQFDIEKQKAREHSKKLLSLHRNGTISDRVLFLYGISGELPLRHTYRQMTKEEKRKLWEDRMKFHYGDSWRQHFSSLPDLFLERTSTINWIKEGF